MTIRNFLSRVFGNSKQQEINLKDFKDDFSSVYLQSFALHTVVEMLANLMTNVEYRTYKKYEKIQKYEWYSLNIRPNRNQNATEFWQEFYSKLLYNQEVLCVSTADGQKIIADSYNIQENAITGHIFSNVHRAEYTFNKNFHVDDVIYVKYSDSNIHNYISNIFAMYDKLISDAKNKYSRNCGERGILEVSALAQGTEGFEERFKKLMEQRFSAYFNNSNAVLPLFEGFKYNKQTATTQQASSEITEIKILFDEALCRAAQIYKVPPALIKGEVAGLEDAFNIMLTVCIDPLATLVSEELTSKLFTRQQIIDGNYISADTSSIKHIDVLEQASNIDKLIASGFYSVNEVRIKTREEKILQDWADEHYMTKNYQNAELMKGSDNNANVGNQTVSNPENS